MAQLTIEIPDELAQRLAPFQNQLPELFTRLIATTLPDESLSGIDLSVSQGADVSPTYLEVLDFLINRPTSEQIATFKVSERSQTRLQELLQKNCDANLSSSEVAELNLYEQLDALMTMLKIRAYTAQKYQGTSSVPNPA
ncbi:hypothetical protein V2H45_03965 [Tumidithrix elongata RA019]|uniref:Uncharacterized protein n=1 Tax=Tumidithrix elongata BACA0141 TaxID=2716417 RepID=A0AAW9PPD2_9CYAN|nr:hypothetical protein [Tumidithrix elongata RA019]